MHNKTHEQLMRELNPEGWTMDQHRTHKARIESSTAYRDRIHRLNDLRHTWASEQLELDCKGRRIAAGLRIKIRRELNEEARVKFPAGDPLVND